MSITDLNISCEMRCGDGNLIDSVFGTCTSSMNDISCFLLRNHSNLRHNRQQLLAIVVTVARPRRGFRLSSLSSGTKLDFL